jgi:endonuclease YncB( thermonuclease family)
MVKKLAICVQVIDGNTFVTAHDFRIRLARVKAPPTDTADRIKAKMLLEAFISGNVIDYQVESKDYDGSNIAEVWVRNKNINDAMISAGYKKSLHSS